FPEVIKLTEEALATRSKDLQLAVWLTEALLKTEGFSGLHQGLELIRGLVEKFWDSLYPVIENGDLEFRANKLAWLDTYLDFPVKSVPLAQAESGAFSWIQYTDSRRVPYGKPTASQADKDARQKKLEKDGKVA